MRAPVASTHGRQVSSDREDALVSVIIPAHNAGRTIERTIRSVMAQTHQHVEIIVVDDGSNDDTAARVECLAANDSRIRLICQSNAGVAAARNAGARIARGAFVAPVDADDLWHPEKIAKQVAVMDRGGGRIGLVYCWSAVIDADDLILSRCHIASTFEGNVYWPIRLHNFIGNASAPLVRRDLFLAVGGYDPRLRDFAAQGCEDWLLYVLLAEITEFGVVREALVGYRETATSMSTDVTQMIRSNEIVRREILRRTRSVPARFVWLQHGLIYDYLWHLSYRTRNYALGLKYLLLTAFFMPNRFPRYCRGAIRRALWGKRRMHLGPRYPPSDSDDAAALQEGRQERGSYRYALRLGDRRGEGETTFVVPRRWLS